MPTASPLVCGNVCICLGLCVAVFYGAVSDRRHFRVIKFSKLEIKCFKYFNKRTTNLIFFSVLYCYFRCLCLYSSVTLTALYLFVDLTFRNECD